MQLHTADRNSNSNFNFNFNALLLIERAARAVRIGTKVVRGLRGATGSDVRNATGHGNTAGDSIMRHMDECRGEIVTTAGHPPSDP